MEKRTGRRLVLVLRDKGVWGCAVYLGTMYDPMGVETELLVCPCFVVGRVCDETVSKARRATIGARLGTKRSNFSIPDVKKTLHFNFQHGRRIRYYTE